MRRLLNKIPSILFPGSPKSYNRQRNCFQILLQVWPNVNHFARTLIKDTIEPAVAESLSNFKLNGFKFERMILGTIVRAFTGISKSSNMRIRTLN